MITQDFLKKHFEYVDGQLVWRKLTGRRAKVGFIAGSQRPDGYIYVGVNGKDYPVHRLIFCYHHGFLPKYVDHINGAPGDNRIENLRQATKCENAYNAKLHTKSSSGVKNVYWCKRKQKWQVQLQANHKRKHMGYFDDIELAELVAIEARDKYHKEFARHQ